MTTNENAQATGVESTGIESAAPAPTPARAGFTAPRKELLAALRGVKTATGKLAVNRDVRLSVNGTVAIHAGSGGQWVTVEREWTRDGEADISIDPRSMINSLSASKAETASIEIDGKTVRVVCGGGEVQLPCDDGFHPPQLPPARQLFVMDVRDVRRAVDRVIFAADVESIRYALGGLCVEMNEHGQAVFVATDSRRLAAATVSAVFWGDGASELIGDNGYDATRKQRRPAGIVLPVAFWETLLKLAPKAGVVTFSMVQRPLPGTDKESCFRRYYVATVGGVQVETVAVDGRFPRWREVIPSESGSCRVVFNSDSMTTACKAAMVGTDCETRGVDLSAEGYGYADGREGRLRLKAVAAVATCEARFLDLADSFPASITFDVRFIGEGMRAVGDEQIVGLFVDDGTPAVFSSPGWQYVVMPLSRDR